MPVSSAVFSDLLPAAGDRCFSSFFDPSSSNFPFVKDEKELKGEQRDERFSVLECFPF